MRLAMRRSVWWGDVSLEAGSIVSLPEDDARQVVATGAADVLPDVPGLAPTQEFATTPALEHREPAVSHRDPPKAKRRGA